MASRYLRDLNTAAGLPLGVPVAPHSVLLNPPLSAIVADAAGTLTLAGSADASLAVQGAATGTLVPSGAATVALTDVATASGTLVPSGASTDALTDSATEAGTLTPIGAAGLAVTDTADALGLLVVQGASDASLRIVADAAGVLVPTGSADVSVPADGGVLVDAFGTIALVGESAVTVEEIVLPATTGGGWGASKSYRPISLEVPKPVTVRARGRLTLVGAANASTVYGANAHGVLTLVGDADADTGLSPIESLLLLAAA